MYMKATREMYCVHVHVINCDCCCHSSLFEWVKEREQKKEDITQVRMDIFRKRLVCTHISTFTCTYRSIPSEAMYITRLLVTILVVRIIAKTFKCLS